MRQTRSDLDRIGLRAPRGWTVLAAVLASWIVVAIIWIGFDQMISFVFGAA